MASTQYRLSLGTSFTFWSFLTNIVKVSLATNCSEIECITGDSAVATFDNWGIEGTVKVIRGHINVSLSLADFDFDESVFVSDLGGTSCFAGGLYYGIYDSWTRDSDDSEMGPDACGIESTGRRWDPWLACSTLSNNPYCDSHSSDSTSCVPASTWLSDADDAEYVCSDVNYQTNPFSCEVGDWSGKYGVARYDASTQTITATGGSAFEVDGIDLSGKSVVFRCRDRTRAFCAKFDDYEPSEVEEELYERRPVQNGTYSKIAKIGDSSHVKLTYYGNYEIVLSSNDIQLGGSCSNDIFYRIFWSEDGEDPCDADDVGFLDPTITCDEDSRATGYCTDTERCGDGDYFYSCVYDGSDGWANRFDCAPADLADKYGSADTQGNLANFRVNISGSDGLMLPLAMITSGASIVLQCDDYSLIGCYPFEDFTDDAGLFGTIVPSDETEDDDSSGSGGNNKNSSSSGFLGISETAGTILLILLALSVIPCIKHYRDKKRNEADPAQKNQTAGAMPAVDGMGTNGSRGPSRSASRGGSRNNSRPGSKPNSRPGSVVGSRAGSRGGSRAGSQVGRAAIVGAGAGAAAGAGMGAMQGQGQGPRHVMSGSYAASITGGSQYGGGAGGGGGSVYGAQALQQQTLDSRTGTAVAGYDAQAGYDNNGAYNDYNEYQQGGNAGAGQNDQYYDQNQGYDEYNQQYGYDENYGQQQGYGNEAYGNENYAEENYNEDYNEQYDDQYAHNRQQSSY